MAKDEFDETDKTPRPGHNSGIDPGYLKNLVKELEALDTEIDGLKADRKTYLEAAKEHGYSTKIVNKLVSLRKKREEAKAEQELLEQYDHASGSEIFD